MRWSSIANDLELRALGFVRARDGVLLDNSDSFYSDFPDDHLRLYDARSHVAISRKLLDKLLAALEHAAA